MDSKDLYAGQLLRKALNWCQPDVPGRLREAMEAGADPNSVIHLNPGADTALSQAIRNHDPEAVAVLLAHGADPDLPINPYGRKPTAMQHARGCASDGRRFGWVWAERAFEVERLMIEALDRDIQD